MPERHPRGSSHGPRAAPPPAGALARSNQGGARIVRRRQARLRAGVLAFAIPALALGALTGCGGGGATSESSGSTSAPSAPDSPAETTTAPASQPPAQAKPGKPETGKPGDQKPDLANPAKTLPPKYQIDYAIKGVLASGLPSLACDDSATKNFVKTTFGDRAGCERASVPASAASFVDVTAIVIKGDKATATARPTGGPSDGETIKVELRRQGGAWKVDSLRSNAPVGP